VRAILAVLALASTVGCAELGVVTDGTSVSYGIPSRGYLIDGMKLPDKGDGFTTREVWAERGNRYGTNELVDMLKAVAKRMRTVEKVKDVRLVIADLSSNGGGAAHLFHRSHQSGRDVDVLYYMRDIEGRPFEADAMRAFDRNLAAKDKSGITVDVPRTWQLVKELLTADEAVVQYIFMYQPIAQKLIEHAQAIHEDPVLIARAIKACRQPNDSAKHDDHMHVRVYCSADDRQFGCKDIGPLDLLAEREAEKQKTLQLIADALPRAQEPPAAVVTASDVWSGNAPPQPMPPALVPPALPQGPASMASSNGAMGSTDGPSASFNSLLRARADRIDLRGWR